MDMQESADAIQALGMSLDQLRQIRRVLANGNKLTARAYLQSQAKAFETDPIDLRRLIARFTAAEIRQNEQGPLYHYHRTTLQAFRNIINQGALQSRIKQTESTGRTFTHTSASNNVMMTRDRYDRKGVLVSPGITGYMVAGGNITFVFKPEIMDLEEYDPIGMYPEAPEIPLNLIQAVLVNDGSEEIKEVKEVLRTTSHEEIPIHRVSSWIEAHYKATSEKDYI